MPLLSRPLTYTFRVTNQHYLDTLIAYAGDLEIGVLNPSYGISYENKKIKDLPELIEQIKSHPDRFIPEDDSEDLIITITTKVFRITQSLMKVFPQFQLQADLQDDPRYEESIGMVSEYIRVKSGPTDKEPDITMSPLTREEAWKVLHLAYKKTPFLSAIDIPSRSSFMCLTLNGSVFSVPYGNVPRKIFGVPYETVARKIFGVLFEPVARKISSHAFGFDIDDGFFAQELREIPQELETAGRRWVDNGQKGPVLHQPNVVLANNSNLPSTQPANALTHRHGKNSFSLKSLLLVPAVVGLVYLSSFSLPVILAISAFRYYRDSVGCKKALAMKGPKAAKLSADESCAFQAGIQAGKTNRGFLNAWRIKQTYTHYDTYGAGKHLAEHNAEQDVVVRVRRPIGG